MKKKILWTIAISIVAAAILWGPIVSNVEQAKYVVIKKDANIEVRDYEPMIVAETNVSGDREKAINNGFRAIADYIFGNNQSTQKVNMTAPVIQKPVSEKIAMTAPVIQTAEGKTWLVRFVMPASYTMETLPKPINQLVKLKQIPASRYVAVRFSGVASKQNIQENTALLEDYINKHHLKPRSQATYAFFNPPWTLPFLRRNEVMIEVDR